MKSTLNIQQTSCLFLDRDGVINTRLIDDYVKSWAEFELIDGVIDALQILQKQFKTIVIVTNQQGIGKGLYTIEDLHTIHNNMLQFFEDNNIKINAVFFAPQLKSENSDMRKPAIGMALKAKQIFKNINLENSVMVGDSISDMHFGKNAGMKTVFIKHENDKETYDEKIIDFTFNSLLSFAKNLE